MGVGMQCYYCKRPFEAGPGFIRHQAECHQRALARRRMIKKAEERPPQTKEQLEKGDPFEGFRGENE